jgi:hypothetical protein
MENNLKACDLRTLSNSGLREWCSKEAKGYFFSWSKELEDYGRWKRSMSRIKKIMRLLKRI